MADDLIQTLTRFHREVVMPDVQQAIDRAFDTRLTPFRNEVLTHLDAIYQKLDRLETEYQAIKAAVIRLEQRMERVDARLAVIEETLKIELRQEIDEIKARISQLQERVAELEAQL